MRWFSRYISMVFQIHSCSSKHAICLHETGSRINSPKLSLLQSDYVNGRSPVIKLPLKPLTPSKWCKYSNLSPKIIPHALSVHNLIVSSCGCDESKLETAYSLSRYQNQYFQSFCYLKVLHFGPWCMIWFCMFQRFRERLLWKQEVQTRTNPTTDLLSGRSLLGKNTWKSKTKKFFKNCFCTGLTKSSYTLRYLYHSFKFFDTWNAEFFLSFPSIQLLNSLFKAISIYFPPF